MLLLDIRFATARNASGAVAVVVPAGGDTTSASDDPSSAQLAAARFAAVRLSLGRLKLGPADLDDVTAFLADVEHSGSAGTMHKLPRPGRRPDRLLFIGVGAGEEADWRAAGAKLAKSASSEPTLMVVLPDDVTPAAVRGLGEGLWLASYRFRLGADDPPALRRIVLVPPSGAVAASADLAAGLALAKAVAESTVLARDLTNMPSDEKTPAWFAKRVEKAAAGVPGLTTTVRDPKALAEEGFNAILAVGGGSTRGPRLLELSWRPRGARRHVVLIGKGITFDTGGICVKPLSGMKLMRKDMAGAAAVIGATLAAAALRLPLRVTAIAPLAENALGADSFRPGDVVRHYGGTTSEIYNTDAEGRLVLGDAMAYAVRRLRPDAIIDLATLTGAQGVALGKRTAALYSHSDTLATSLAEAAATAGESMWRMPLHDDYADALDSDVADLVNSTDIGAGSLMAALYLREFTGGLRDQWAHLDMSSSAWADSADGELTKGATGWGVRTLLRWLEATA
ncbi:leucyl aminopeptidase family protein [Dactylosporangium sp. NBC_01737]|uniref:leucyl aminopeptidase family protein n=1 Tax=Dactylosporangium sp. NBC_01737 TaxID=2975959 RepID=UPI002E10B25A|nr:leucyl aminopeptidase family protein [Dactylosporangium sp. NBC_01737]